MQYHIREAVYQDCDELMRVQDALLSLRRSYPKFQDWLNRKVIPQLGKIRKIIIAQNEKKTIVGIMILKNTCAEKKICTLWVHRDYQKNGIGTALMERAIRELQTSRPLITMSQESYAEFLPLMRKFHFELKKRYHGYYKAGITEYAFNGLLKDDGSVEYCIIFDPSAICTADIVRREKI